MTAARPATLRQLITRSDDHPALVVPESRVSLSYAALQSALDHAAGRPAALAVPQRDGSATAATVAADAGVPASVMGMEGALLHIDGQAGDPLEATGDPDALALLLHTSGTTSKPKTVPIRQRNLVASTGAVARTYGLTGDDVTMCVMPLFHVHGLVATVLGTLSVSYTHLRAHETRHDLVC